MSQPIKRYKVNSITYFQSISAKKDLLFEVRAIHVYVIRRKVYRCLRGLGYKQPEVSYINVK